MGDMKYFKPPAPLHNEALAITRLPEHQIRYPELKDPSVVKVKEDFYVMFASIGSSVTQTWIVGRFISDRVDGLWQEVSPVTFHNLSGAQLCAPAVWYDAKSGMWTMYVQDCCFNENGYIALARSEDGENFYGHPQALFNRNHVASYQPSVVGLYDAGISTVTLNNEEYLCLLFSGYRRVGCGDIFMSYRKKSATEDQWSEPQRILTQEEVPFHNHPNYEWFEWGLEGAQIIELSPESYLMIGVCFMPKPDGYLGTRQRVFYAHATSLLGPFVPLTVPFLPQEIEGKRGENGHPDAFIENGKLWVVFQERFGDGQPWHFRQAAYDVERLKLYFETIRHPSNYVQDVTFPEVTTIKSEQML